MKLEIRNLEKKGIVNLVAYSKPDFMKNFKFVNLCVFMSLWQKT